MNGEERVQFERLIGTFNEAINKRLDKHEEAANDFRENISGIIARCQEREKANTKREELIGVLFKKTKANENNIGMVERRLGDVIESKAAALAESTAKKIKVLIKDDIEPLRAFRYKIIGIAVFVPASIMLLMRLYSWWKALP